MPPSVAAVQPAPQPVAKPPAPLPDDAKELLAQARAAMGRKAYDKAVPMLEKALGLVSDAEQRMMIQSMLAESLAATQQYEAAANLYRQMMREAPGDPERGMAAVRLSQIYFMQNKFAEAEKALDEVQFAGTNQVEATAIQYAKLRIWQAQPGRLAEAASNLEAKVTANPSDKASLELLGTIYYKVQSDFEKAKPIYEKILAVEPTNTVVQNTLLGIYQQTRDFDKARAIYEQYLTTYPDQADGIHFQIATMYVQSGQGDDAVEYAEQYLGGNNATPTQLSQLATIQDYAGRLDEAAYSLARAVQLETDTAQKAEFQFQQADYLVRQQKYVEAELILRTILDANRGEQSTVTRANSELFRIYQMQGKISDLNL